ncbi:complement factor H-related protein 1-like [Branchiostoma lanceolatum]|uniref:complement factor H-related protein 1-like n=1 Tax=Branchiostoma lanceolatum TaxID=7740 RepID=UPI00345502AB
MSRLAVGVLLLAAVGLLGPRPVRADDSDEGHGHHEDEHQEKHVYGCPDGYEEFEGHCYYFSGDTKATYSDAAAQCAAQDGRLATPDCHNEHAADFFYRTVAWISRETEEDCSTKESPPESQLPFICMYAPTCDEPPAENNTVISGCDAPYDQQEVCSYACAPGYHMYEGTESSATSTCLDGNWHGPLMECNENCPDPTLNEGVTMKGESCQAPYITGDICFLECEEGDPLEGDHDMSCFDGKWIHAATGMAVIPIVCPPPI